MQSHANHPDFTTQDSRPQGRTNTTDDSSSKLPPVGYVRFDWTDKQTTERIGRLVNKIRSL